jgi:shikimate kinase
VTGTRILLVGMMGAGKTTVGRTLAARTGWEYLDNDELVQRLTGRTAPELAAEGEAVLREVEASAMDAAIELPPPVVAGIAGGVVLDPANRDRLMAAREVVWLRARHDTLVRRVGSGAGRAWLRPDPAAAIEELAAHREPYYQQVADLIVDVDGKAPDAIAREILAGVSDLTVS